jgi:hypothetical protein
VHRTPLRHAVPMKGPLLDLGANVARASCRLVRTNNGPPFGGGLAGWGLAARGPRHQILFPHAAPYCGAPAFTHVPFGRRLVVRGFPARCLSTGGAMSFGHCQGARRSGAAETVELCGGRVLLLFPVLGVPGPPGANETKRDAAQQTGCLPAACRLLARDVRRVAPAVRLTGGRPATASHVHTHGAGPLGDVEPRSRRVSGRTGGGGGVLPALSTAGADRMSFLHYHHAHAPVLISW